MAASLAQANPEVSIRNQDKHIQVPRDQGRIFGAAEKMLRDLLAEKGYTGSFHLMASRAVKGGSARQGIRFRCKDEDQHRIQLSIQPGSNDTAWQYWMYPPRDVDIADLYYAFTAGKGQVDDCAEAEQAIVEDEMQAGEPEGMAILELMPVPAAPAVGPVEFVNDLSIVALAIGPCFTRPDSRPSPQDVVETLQEEMTWEEGPARQAYQCLINRHHLKLNGEPGHERLLIGSDELRAAFREIGLHQEIRRERPIPSIPTPTPPAPVPAAPAPRAPRRRSPAPVAKSDDAGLASTFEELTRRATVYDTARRDMLAAAKTRATLTQRCEQARRALDDAQAEVAELEAQVAAHLEILSDANYSEAATKLSQIRAIIG